MGYNEITSGRDGFIQHSFGNVKTQQSPCCFRMSIRFAGRHYQIRLAMAEARTVQGRLLFL